MGALDFSCKMAALEARACLHAGGDLLCPLSARQLPAAVLQNSSAAVWAGQTASHSPAHS